MISLAGRSPIKQAPLLAWLIAATALAAVLLAITAQAADAKKKNPVGAVYTQTNNPGGNKVVVFDRNKSGKLRKRESVPTGGNGSTQSVGCGPGCPILDSQNAVVVSDNGKLVAAVNAGSDTVSSFRETSGGLVQVDQEDSDGDTPESLALNGNVLYVLNVDTDNGGTTGNISGFELANNGELTPIPGSSQPLANAAPPDNSASARAIGFKPNGKVLVVTELAAGFMGPPPPPGAIDTFVVDSNGVAGPVTEYPSSDPLPFGFAFNSDDQLVVSNILDPSGNTEGTVSTYTVSDAGVVTPIDTQPTHGILPCWVVVSKDDQFTYVVNTGAGKPGPVSILGLDSGGSLSFLGLSDWLANEFARTDAALSRDSKFLYVLAPSVGVPGAAPSHVDVYKRRADGGLNLVQQTPGNIGKGATGLAAR